MPPTATHGILTGGVAADQPKRRGTDWIAARDFWLALDPGVRSYGAVAHQFGITDTRVRYVAKRDGWAEHAADLDEKALESLKRRVIKTRDERNEIFLRIVDAANEQALDKLTAKQLEVRLSDLPALGKHAELILGEATDRISFAELQEALGVVLTIATRFVPKRSRAEFLAAVRERLGQIGGSE
ncbi:MAG: hypothetical protein ACJ768_12760 [Gaiellaceae bacterium]